MLQRLTFKKGADLAMCRQGRSSKILLSSNISLKNINPFTLNKIWTRRPFFGFTRLSSGQCFFGYNFFLVSFSSYLHPQYLHLKSALSAICKYETELIVKSIGRWRKMFATRSKLAVKS